MRIRLVAVLAGAVIIPLAKSQAQTCLGAASFSAGNMRLGAGVDVGDKSKAFSGDFAIGSTMGPFATAGLSTVQYDDVSGNGIGFNVNAGYAVKANATGTAQLCPIVGFSYQNAPDIESEFGSITSSYHAFVLGGALGGVASSSPGLDFVPFVSAGYVLSQASASVAGFSQSQNDNYGVIGLGAGLVFNRAVTIRPSVGIPVGLEGAKPRYGLSIGFSFGTTSR